MLIDSDDDIADNEDDSGTTTLLHEMDKITAVVEIEFSDIVTIISTDDHKGKEETPIMHN